MAALTPPLPTPMASKPTVGGVGWIEWVEEIRPYEVKEELKALGLSEVDASLLRSRVCSTRFT